jgi:opacity protein-like surface antigen
LQQKWLACYTAAALDQLPNGLIMKKILSSASSTAVLFLLSTSIFAANYKFEALSCNNCRNEPELHDGFYLGLAGGYEAYNMQQSNALTDPGVVALTYNPSNYASGFVGGIYGGYGRNVGTMFYLGGEAYVNDTSASNSNTFVATVPAAGAIVLTAKQYANMTYGLFILPGIKLSPVSLFYLRLGYSYVEVTQKFTGAGVSVSGSNSANGFAYGLGLETLIVDNWSLRGDFTHVNYGYVENHKVTALGVIADAKLTPTDNQFLLAISYHFFGF